jgi:branched-chain amino acid transport system ATP-binding protein
MAEAAARASAPVITGNPLLQVRELHAWYDESHVLHGVDFDVRPGEVVTLLGRNGAGKTTTLKSVMGIVGKRRGSVRFGAAELIGMPSNRIARLGLAFCPEERGIFASLSVEENLLLPPVVAPGGLAVEAVFGLFRTCASGSGARGPSSRGRAADARHRPHPPDGRAPAPPRRADGGTRPGDRAADRGDHPRLKLEGFTILLVEQNFRFAATVADRHYVMEHGLVVDMIANAELDRHMDKLHGYLGV